jgi:alpha-1,2-mannosyltransferase
LSANAWLLIPNRPEKDHMLQLQSFAKLLNDNPDLREGKKETKLVLIGSARNEGDEKRIQSLRLAAKELNIEVTNLVVVD